MQIEEIGCVLSPSLFNIYFEKIRNNLLSDENIRVKLNRYVDDARLIATSFEDLQTTLNRVLEASK